MRRVIRGLLLWVMVLAGLIRNGRSPKQPREIRRILLIRPDHLGDVLLATPALAELRGAFPAAHITALVGPWSREVLARNSHVDAVETCAFPGFRREEQGALEPYRLLWRLAGQVRQQHYDLALVLRPDFWWGVWLVYLAGIPVRIGYAHALQTRFLTLALLVEPYEHVTSQNLRLVRAAALLPAPASGSLALHPPPLQMALLALRPTRAGKLPAPQNATPLLLLEFAPTEEERAWVRERLAAAGIAEAHKIVVIHPGTGAPVKLWETGNWARVADRLAQQHDVRVVLTGTEGERALVTGVAGQMQAPVLTLIGELDIGKLAALLRRATLVLGVDSGPLHLATAQGTPTVRLYGPTDPRIFGPWGAADRHSVIQAKQACPGCAAIPCGRLDWLQEELPEHPCVRSVSVEEVLAAADRLLAGAEAG